MHAFIGREPGLVRVVCATGADELTVTVTDNGRGMQPRADSPGARARAADDRPAGGARGPARAARRRHRALDDVLDARRARARRGGARDVERDRAARRPSRAPRRAPGRGRAWSALVDLLVPNAGRRLRGRRDRRGGYPERFAGRIDGPEGRAVALARLAAPARRRARSATPPRWTDGQPHVSELTLDLIERITTNADDAATMAATGIRWWVVDPAARGRAAARPAALRDAARARAPLDELLEFLRAVGERAAAGLAHTQLIAELQRIRHRFERILDVLGEA